MDAFRDTAVPVGVDGEVFYRHAREENDIVTLGAAPVTLPRRVTTAGRENTRRRVNTGRRVDRGARI